MLTGSDPKGYADRMQSVGHCIADMKFAGVVKESNPFVFIVRNVETPYRSKKLDSSPQGLPMMMWEQEVGKSKCCFVMKQIPVFF